MMLTREEGGRIVKRARAVESIATVTVMGRGGWFATGSVGYVQGYVQAKNAYEWFPWLVYGGDGDY